jgi:SAM-dependent methyltransferase
MSMYVLSSLSTIDEVGANKFTVTNGFNAQFNINTAMADVLAAFKNTESIGNIVLQNGGSEELNKFLHMMVDNLILVSAEIDHQDEMRKTWNCLSKSSKEDAAFFIDNETKTMEEFDVAGREGVEALGNIIEINSAWSVVNIGCGMGRVEKYLSPLVSSIVSFDISDVMLERAKEYLTSTKNVELRQTDGTLCGIESGGVDMVFSFFVFQHCPKVSTWKYIAEASKVLSKGGIFLFQILFYDDMQGYEKSEVSPIGRYYGPGKE